MMFGRRIPEIGFKKNDISYLIYAKTYELPSIVELYINYDMFTDF